MHFRPVVVAESDADLAAALELCRRMKLRHSGVERDPAGAATVLDRGEADSVLVVADGWFRLEGPIGEPSSSRHSATAAASAAGAGLAMASPAAAGIAVTGLALRKL